MKSFASRLLPGCNFAELLDVGAGDKGASRASQDSGLDLGVAFNRFHRCQNAFQDAGTEGVHGGIVDRNNGDISVFAELNQFVHETALRRLISVLSSYETS